MTLEELCQKCASCQKCELGSTRTNLVFGAGNKNAKLMFVGEAPGEQEDLSGIPFVGRAGKLFDKYLEAVGISRDEVYIANMLKCRPPQNRDPKPAEMDQCIDWLRNLVHIMRPKIIVCVGRISAQRLISPDFRVTRDHGVFYDKNGTLMMGTFHPAALLRDPRRKGDCFEDFLKLQDKIKELGIKI